MRPISRERARAGEFRLLELRGDAPRLVMGHAQGSVALSLWTTAHPLCTILANMFGASISERKMRPNPRHVAGGGAERQVLTMDDDSQCLLWDAHRGRCLGGALVPDPASSSHHHLTMMTPSSHHDDVIISSHHEDVIISCHLTTMTSSPNLTPSGAGPLRPRARLCGRRLRLGLRRRALPRGPTSSHLIMMM
jgi:hypothetical protein